MKKIAKEILSIARQLQAGPILVGYSMGNGTIMVISEIIYGGLLNKKETASQFGKVEKLSGNFMDQLMTAMHKQGIEILNHWQDGAYVYVKKGFVTFRIDGYVKFDPADAPAVEGIARQLGMRQAK